MYVLRQALVQALAVCVILLMPGGWIPATSRVNAFSLYGRPVPRS